jgi:hypothetical protein
MKKYGYAERHNAKSVKFSNIRGRNNEKGF